MKTLEPCTITLSMAELRFPISYVCFFAATFFLCCYTNYSRSECFLPISETLWELSHLGLTSRALSAKTNSPSRSNIFKTTFSKSVLNLVSFSIEYHVPYGIGQKWGKFYHLTPYFVHNGVRKTWKSWAYPPHTIVYKIWGQMIEFPSFLTYSVRDVVFYREWD